MFAAASGLRLAARRCLIFPPPLSARALVEAFPLHVLEQPGLGDLAAELLQDIVQSVAVAHHYFHVPASLPFGAARNDKGPWAAAQVLGAVSGCFARANDRWLGGVCQPCGRCRSLTLAGQVTTLHRVVPRTASWHPSEGRSRSGAGLTSVGSIPRFARNTNTSRRRHRAEDVTQRRRAKTSPHASA